MAEVKRINSINGLKGILCLVIAYIAHTYSITGFGKYSNLTVELFVAISGFGMAFSYKYKLKDYEFKTYFWKKYIKIMPLYWLTLLCLQLYQLHFYSYSTRLFMAKNYSITDLFFEFSGAYTGWYTSKLLPLNSPLWTVNTLLLCYIIYYFICKISNGSNNRYFILMCGLLVIGIMGIYNEWDIPIVCHKSSRAYASFAVGALIYELYENIKQVSGRIISYILIGIAIIIAIVKLYFRLSVIVLVGNLYVFTTIFICPLVILSTIYIPVIRNILSTKVFQFLGSISMSLYMWHSFVKTVCDVHWWSNRNKELILYIIISFIVAVISKYGIEKIIDKLREVISNKIKAAK